MYHSTLTPSMTRITDSTQKLSDSVGREKSPTPLQIPYTQLHHDDSFRLFRFDTVSINQKPALKLETFRLSNNPEFIAISYMWGPRTTEKEILVNNCLIYIRQNLWDVLQSLLYHQQAGRAICEDTYFFVDAICISQESLDEKNHQVSHIDRIFKTALRVFAYLGSDEWIEKAIRLYNADDQQAFHLKICKAPYWKRTWIIQELVLAQRLVLFSGKALLKLDLTEASYVHGVPLEGNRVSTYAHIIYMRIHRKDPMIHVEESLVSLLDSFSFSQCENQLDKVFALQSLAPPHLRCKVNYRTTLIALFWEVLIASVNTCGYDNAVSVTRALEIPLEAAFRGTREAVADASKPSILVYEAMDGTFMLHTNGSGPQLRAPPIPGEPTKASNFFKAKGLSQLNRPSPERAKFTCSYGRTWLLTHGAINLSSDYIISYRSYIFLQLDPWRFSSDEWRDASRSGLCFVISSSTRQICGVITHSDMMSSKAHLIEAFDECWQQSSHELATSVSDGGVSVTKARVSPLLFAACCRLHLEQEKYYKRRVRAHLAKISAPFRAIGTLFSSPNL